MTRRPSTFRSKFRSRRLARTLIDNFEECVAALLLAVIGLSMTAQVLLRSLFGIPMTWPEELSQFLFVWASTLGVLGAIKRKSMIRLELLASAAPQWVARPLKFVVLIGVFALLGVMFWYGLQMARRTSFAAATLPISWAWAYASAPAFSVLAVLRLVQAELFAYDFLFIEKVILEDRPDLPSQGEKE